MNNNTQMTHLSNADPVMADLIAQLGPLDLRRRLELPPDDHFGALVYGIVCQQISEAAGRAILARLCQYFGGSPTPERLFDTDLTQLQSFGLTIARSRYLHGLAESVATKSLDLKHLDALNNDEVVAHLTAVRGIGPWTAYQFLLWHLERPDVLPRQDVFLLKAVCRLYHLAKLPTPEEFEALAAPWRPYRSLACHYLLRSRMGPGVSPAWPSVGPQPYTKSNKESTPINR